MSVVATSIISGKCLHVQQVEQNYGSMNLKSSVKLMNNLFKAGHDKYMVLHGIKDNILGKSPDFTSGVMFIALIPDPVVREKIINHFTMSNSENQLSLVTARKLLKELNDYNDDNHEGESNKAYFGNHNTREKSSAGKFSDGNGNGNGNGGKSRCKFCNKPGRKVSDCRTYQRFLKIHNESKHDGNTSTANSKIHESWSVFLGNPDMDKFKNSQEYIFNSGATVHVSNTKDNLINYRAVNGEYIKGLGGKIKVLGYGDIKINFKAGRKILLTNVALVPQSPFNLVSIPKIISNAGVRLVFTADGTIEDESGNILASLDNHLYKAELVNQSTESVYYGVDQSLSLSNYDRWHLRLGHPSSYLLNKINEDIGLGLSKEDQNDDHHQAY